jgi:uncharacterized membrane protein YhaH (DUF805 family)
MDLVGLMLKPMGRIGRRDYWIGVAIITVVVVLASRFDDIVGTILFCSTLYLGICVHGKRLHDIGKSAWGILVPIGFCIFVIPVVTVLSGGLANPTTQFQTKLDTPVGSVVEALPLLIVFILPAWVIWLGSRKSQVGDNKYGPGQDATLPKACD